MRSLARRRRQQIRIRQIRSTDLPAVLRLGQAAFSRVIPYSRRMWTEREVMSSMLAYPDLCLVAERRGRVVGFVLGEVVKREGGKVYCYLKWIAVSRRYKSQRLGTRLLRVFRARAVKRNCFGIFCDVEEDNEDALAFFKARGFREDQRVIYMWKALRGSEPHGP